MFQIENLSKAFGGDAIFEEVTFSLSSGERIALVGLNGCGKSTLLRCLTGEEKADGGNIRVPKHYQVGYLQQHLGFSADTILGEVALGLPPGEEEYLYKAETLLFGLGFQKEQMDHHPSQFSGGFQLRIHLAKTLVAEPDCLLLDEPTNYLDIVTIAWLRDFLKNWRGELIVISHDRSFLDAVATHTMGVHRQSLLKVKGGTRSYYDQLLLVEETHARTVEKLEKKKSHAQDFIRRFGAKNTKAKQAQSKQKMLDKMPALERLAEIHNLNFSFREARHPGKVLLALRNMSFRYPEMESPLIEDFSLEVEKGDRIAIIGENGRGKSTLLKLMTDEISAEKGTLRSSEHLRVGYFGQTNIAQLDASRTIFEEIATANRKLTHGEVRAICGAMMFPQAKADKKIGVLSGGERSRVLLGKILATPCNLLLLDEPSNHLDLESVEALMEALEDFPGAVIIVTHVEELLYRLPEKLIICEEGKQRIQLGAYEGYEPGEQVKKEKKTKAVNFEREIAKLEKRLAKLSEDKPEYSALKAEVDELYTLWSKQ